MVNHAMPGAPLLPAEKLDQALRDLMPIMDWLTSYGNASHDGATEAAAYSLAKAIDEFNRIPVHSPTLTAYIHWLAQNTAEGRR